MLSETRAPGLDACAHRGLARAIWVIESGGAAMPGRCRVTTGIAPHESIACSPPGSDFLRHIGHSLPVQYVILMILTPFVVKRLCQFL